jgi:CHAT domain-containing protein/Tfp pilus assembly protein PilF
MNTPPVSKHVSTLILLSLLLIACSVAFAQNQTTAQTPRAAEVFANARQLHVKEGAAKALPLYERALELYRQENDRRGEAITIGVMGNVFKVMGQHVRALEYFERSLAMKRELGDRLEEAKTIANIGLFYKETSDYPKAIEYLNNALTIAKEINSELVEAAALNNLALVYDELGEYRRALEMYNRALALYKEPSSGMGDVIGNIGGVNLLLGEYAEALRYYERALAIDEQLQLKPKIALDLENIGLSLIGLGRSNEALPILNRAINLARDGGMKREEADGRKAKGSALLQLGRYSEALEQYNQARTIYEEAGLNAEPSFKQELIEALGDLGTLQMRLGDAASAEKDFRRAIEMSEAIKHPRGVTVNLISLGDLQLRQRRFSDAIALYNQALSRATEVNDKAHVAVAKIQLAHAYRNLKRFDEAEQQARQARDTARTTQARPLEAEALYSLAEALRTAGRNKDALSSFSEGDAIVRGTANPELIWRFAFGRGQSLEALNRNEEALPPYQKAIQTIESVRNELREERFRAGYIEDKYQVYVTLVQLLLKLERPEEAFVVAERLRARSYLDLLRRGPAPIRNETQRKKESTLQSRIRELQKGLENESAKPQPDQKRQKLELFSKELAAAEQEYENFLDDLSSSEPDYTAVASLKVLERKEISARLPNDTALVQYVVGQNNLVFFVVTADRLHAKVVSSKNADLNSRIETLRALLLRNKTNEWKLPAESLYQILIDPLEDEGWLRGVKKLYVVPHGILHYLPFAVLHHRNGFLIDNYVIAYLPAAAALLPGGNGVGLSRSMLAMAPSNTRLQYTQPESRAVAGYFPRQHKLLVGTQATEGSFKRLANKFDVIHLATHGYFNKSNPLLSGLVLEKDEGNDGRLEVHEVMGLRLKANLVTLSACDTAMGSGYFSEVPPGDDLVGLTRAFLSTGTPTVMASLWELNDRSAVQFMSGFYEQLRFGNKATSLAVAQKHLRMRRGYSHPYYWGAYVLVGRM